MSLTSKKTTISPATLGPYPAYKPSGIGWLGDIPSHWEVRRLKTLCSMKSGDGITTASIESTGKYPVYGGNGLRGYTSEHTHDGDFVLIGRQGALCGNIHIARSKFWASEHAVVATLDVPNCVEWFAAVLETMNLNQYSMSAAQPGIAVERILNLSLPVPPLDEQAAIVSYLDEADERIRRAINAKEGLIELLTEQRQAVIHRAVTRGLDPNAPLKDSGVEWLGDVPVHWEVIPIKRAFVAMDYGISESASNSGTIRLLTMGHLNQGRVTIPSTGGVDAVDKSLLLKKGDLLFNRTNSQELVGKVGLFAGHPTPVTFASYLVRLRPNSRNISEYLNAVLNDVAVLSHIRREAIPSLHQSNLNPTRYGRIKVPLPPLNEQIEIAEHLRKATADIDAAIANAERQLELLGEYRAHLVADVVTGRMDVRSAHETIAGLPQVT